MQIKIKIYSFAVYLASIFILFQSGLLVFKIDIHLSFINLVLIEKLFSMGYSRFEQGNVVFGTAFYVVFALIVLSFVISAFFSCVSKAYRIHQCGSDLYNRFSRMYRNRVIHSAVDTYYHTCIYIFGTEKYELSETDKK